MNAADPCTGNARDEDDVSKEHRARPGCVEATCGDVAISAVLPCDGVCSDVLRTVCKRLNISISSQSAFKSCYTALDLCYVPRRQLDSSFHEMRYGYFLV